MAPLTILFVALLSVENIYSLTTTINPKKVVKNPEELKHAIDLAIPGDVIVLGAPNIGGNYILKANGNPSSPITIKTEDPNAKISGEGPDGNGTNEGTAFTIVGNDWNLHSFTVSGYDTAFSIKSAGNSLIAIAIEKCRVGMDIESEGQNTAMDGLVINTGIVKVAANNVVLSSGAINGNGIKGPVLTLEEGTCGGRISGTTINGAVVVKGNDNKFNANIIQGSIHVTGCRNSFAGQVSPRPVVTDKCANDISSGNVFMRTRE